MGGVANEADLLCERMEGSSNNTIVSKFLRRTAQRGISTIKTAIVALGLPLAA